MVQPGEMCPRNHYQQKYSRSTEWAYLAKTWGEVGNTVEAFNYIS